MSDALRLQWTSPGPVASAFMASMAPVQAIMGPIGSGKTSAVLMKMVKLAREQAPSPRDGVRRFKFCVVRDTYRQLSAATIPSWNHWVPQTLGNWTGGKNEPASHEITFDDGAGPIALGAEFVAIGEHKVEDVLRGYESTAFYLNEYDLLARSVLTFCIGRAGRHPKIVDGGPTWHGVICDFNAPDTESHAYEDFVENLPEGWEFFVQPDGLSPQAENLDNLPPGYYQNQITGQPEWYVNRYIRNRFGFSRAGKPVYPQWNDALHVAPEPLLPIKGLPLVIGGDAGRSPAAVILQRTAFGQWRALDELVAANMGAKTFGKLVAQTLRERYAGFDIAAWGDPAADYAGDMDDEETWLMAVSAASGLRWRPAPCPSNSLTMRLEAVTGPLERLIDGLPGFLLSPTCRILRKGFNAGYRYRKLLVAGQPRFQDKPEKNDYSHPHDALQYALLGGGEHAEVLGRKRGAAAGRRQTRAIDDDWPQGEYGGGGRQTVAYD